MSRLLDALHVQNSGRAPIWLMRQAGRYLPEYRKIKEGRSLFDLFHDTEKIVEITRLPFQRLPLDAAILFSDILTVLDGLKMRYDFQEGIGPIVFGENGHVELEDPAVAYQNVLQAIRVLKKELKIPLLGFAGAPFTIASYILEGKSSKDLKKTKIQLFSEPARFWELLDRITEATIAYLNAQIDAGVDAVQLFDSWANALGIEEFRQVCLRPLQQIVDAVKKRGVPVIVFCRGSCFFAPELASLSPSCISLDWSGSLPEIRKKIPSSIAVQGNLDPMILYGSQDFIRSKVEPLLEKMAGDKGYIFNLGHGLLPDTPVENVEFLVDYVTSRSPAFN